MHKVFKTQYEKLLMKFFTNTNLKFSEFNSKEDQINNIVKKINKKN